MSGLFDGRELFLANLALIDEILKRTARRFGFGDQDAEDFVAHGKLKLIENDYARLASFGGHCDFKTFLTSCCIHLAQDYRNHLWGKWRPSTEARRLGPVAVKLETAIARDGLSPREAVSSLAGHTGHAADELENLAASLPPRSPHRRFIGEDGLETVPAMSGEPWVDQERARRAERLALVLRQTMAGLSAHDQVILKLRFKDDRQVAEIARLLKYEQARLYRDFDRLKKLLRQALEAADIGKEDVEDLLGWKGLDLDLGGEPEDQE